MNRAMDIKKTLDFLAGLKFATIIIGAVDLGLVADSYYNRVAGETYFLSITSIAFILSAALFLASVFGVFNFAKSSKGRIVDIFYHGLMDILIIIGAILMTINVIEETKKHRIRQYTSHRDRLRLIERTCAIIFGYINAFLYGFICVAVYVRKSHTEIS